MLQFFFMSRGRSDENINWGGKHKVHLFHPPIIVIDLVDGVSNVKANLYELTEQP